MLTTLGFGLKISVPHHFVIECATPRILQPFYARLCCCSREPLCTVLLLRYLDIMQLAEEVGYVLDKTGKKNEVKLLDEAWKFANSVIHFLFVSFSFFLFCCCLCLYMGKLLNAQ